MIATSKCTIYHVEWLFKMLGMIGLVKGRDLSVEYRIMCHPKKASQFHLIMSSAEAVKKEGMGNVMHFISGVSDELDPR